jgi:hypothetical protein
MKVREGVFLFGTGLGFDHALLLQVGWVPGLGGLKIPFSFFCHVWRKGSGAVISGTSSFGALL